MESILSTNYYVHFQEKSYSAFINYMNNNFHSKVIVLVDSNTREYCLPHFVNKIDSAKHFEIIEISAGEKYKTLETCIDLE